MLPLASSQKQSAPLVPSEAPSAFSLNPQENQESAFEKPAQSPFETKIEQEDEPASGEWFAPMKPLKFETEEFDQSIPGQLPIQPLPLQAVWSVQRQITDYPPSSRVEAPGNPLASSIAETTINPAEVEHIHQTLDDIQTGQPTDSTVEVITPRRARPGVAPVAKQVRPAESSPQPTATDLTQPTPIQLTPESTPTRSAEPTLVPTEIGPLPNDLWRLLGQSPPTSLREMALGQGITPKKLTPTAEESVSTATDSALSPGELSTPTAQAIAEAEGIATGSATTTSAVQTNPEPESRAVDRATPIELSAAIQLATDIPPTISSSQPQPASSLMDVSPPLSPNFIQTQAEAMPSTQAISQPVSAGESMPAAPAAATAEPLDTDELARQVYAKIKRRLAVEWERLRRR
jgi:hypothetical protein